MPPRKPRADGDNRTRQARGDRRRQQILDAAVELFADKGFRGSGLIELAERVDLTPPGLLYYFGTKERLLREVVAERDRGDHLDFGNPATLSSLRPLGRHNVETALLTRLYSVLTTESYDDDEPLNTFFVDRYETTRDLVRQILQTERRRRRLVPGVDIEQIAMEVTATIVGLEIQWLLDPDRVDLGSAWEAYIDRLVAELIRDPGGKKP